MKRRKSVVRRAVKAAALTGALILTMSVPAGADQQDVLVVNPSCPQLTQDEVHEMVQDASEQFYQNEERREELGAEIRLVKEMLQIGDYPAAEEEYYVLTHGEASMKFLMQTIGDPGENGKYPLYITLHGGGEGPSEANNEENTVRVSGQVRVRI